MKAWRRPRTPDGRFKKVDPETLEHVLADLAERERLQEMTAQFTYAAIGRRWGISHNAVYYHAKRNGY